MGSVQKAGQCLLLIVCLLPFPVRGGPRIDIEIIDPVIPELIDSPTCALVDHADETLHLFVDSIGFWHFFESSEGWECESIESGIGSETTRSISERNGVFHIVSGSDNGALSIVRGNTGQWTEIERTVMTGFSVIRATVDSDGGIWIVSQEGLIQRFWDGQWLSTPRILDPSLDPEIPISVDIASDEDGRVFIGYAAENQFSGCRIVTFDHGDESMESLEEYADVQNVNLRTTSDGRLVCAYEILRMPIRIGVMIRDSSAVWTSHILIQPENMHILDLSVSMSGRIAVLFEPEHNLRIAEFDGSGWSIEPVPFSYRSVYGSGDALRLLYRTDLYVKTSHGWEQERFYPVSGSPVMQISDGGRRRILIEKKNETLPVVWTDMTGRWAWTNVATEPCELDYLGRFVGDLTGSETIHGVISNASDVKYLRIDPGARICIDIAPGSFFSVIRVDAGIADRLDMIALDKTYSGLTIYHLAGIPPALSIHPLFIEIAGGYEPVAIDTLRRDDGVYVVCLSEDYLGTWLLTIDGDSIDRQLITETSYGSVDVEMTRFNHPMIVATDPGVVLYRFNGEIWHMDQWDSPEAFSGQSVTCQLDAFGNAIIFVTHPIWSDDKRLVCIEYNGRFGNVYPVDFPVPEAKPGTIMRSNRPGDFVVSGEGLFYLHAEPAVPSFNIALNETIFREGDHFEMAYTIQNGATAADFAGVCLLEVPVGETNLYYSIPSFMPDTEGIDRMECHLGPDEVRRGVLCRFVWPETDQSGDDLGIWSALLSPDLTELKSSIYRQSFSYSME